MIHFMWNICKGKYFLVFVKRGLRENLCERSVGIRKYVGGLGGFSKVNSMKNNRDNQQNVLF
jgi:hypothetical protein